MVALDLISLKHVLLSEWMVSDKGCAVIFCHLLGFKNPQQEVGSSHTLGKCVWMGLPLLFSLNNALAHNRMM